ncbi:MAG: T9SS type A sorting domain-containing protein, partial [Chlamydiia bacterium]|nr:T9SS type A sorting domain-containing protein [Chlamydiia bacterium]
MKKGLLFVAVMLLGMQTVFAQTNVTVVNADYNTDEFAKIQIALDALNSADYTVSVIDTVAAFADISGADVVLFYKGNDGICKDLWDVTSSTLVLTEHMLAYSEAGGVLWLDGLDMLYSAYGSAPDDFVAGDFMYDILGVSKYASQSKADDGGLGISDYVKDASASIMTVESITWDYSTLHYADGLEITANASPLYKMGGATDYPLKDQVTALYKENFIFSGIRLGKMKVQADLDQLILDVLSAAKAGSFAKTSTWSGSDYHTEIILSIAKNNTTEFGIFPNPATNGFVTIQAQNNESISSIEVFNTLGKSVRSISVKNNSKVSLDVQGLTQGLYFVKATTDGGVA